MLNQFSRKIGRFALLGVLIISSLALTACTKGPTIPASEALVTAAVSTLNTLRNRPDLERFNSQLKNAAGVAIFPAVYKAGFFIGGEGGTGLLLAKDAKGNWGYPAFYTIASGSWGLQFGGQKSGVILILRSPGAVEAVIKHQGKISAEADVTAGHVGTGLEGSVTTNLGADIIAYSDSKGLFGGVALEGSAFVRRNDLNTEYYGGQVEPSAVVIQHAHQNPQAYVLRQNLNK